VMHDLPKQKPTRLHGYDYSSPGVYFVTVCTKGRRELLSKIVGTGVLDGPKNFLTSYGEIAHKHLVGMSDFYDNVKIDKFIIMPNHIHLLIHIHEGKRGNGPSWTPVPTNSLIVRLISTFKRFCNKEYGENIWQRSFHDHIIRNEQDYLKIWNYIDTNADKWEQDCFYVKEKE